MPAASVCSRIWSSNKPAEHGIFYDEHVNNSGDPHPYGRFQLPKRPLTLRELPDEMVRAIGAVEFASLCFAETVFIQPVEHVPSFSYGDTQCAFVGTDGWVRPMPGHEDKFRERYGEPPDWPPGEHR